MTKDTRAIIGTMVVCGLALCALLIHRNRQLHERLNAFEAAMVEGFASVTGRAPRRRYPGGGAAPAPGT